jgi:quinol monooxygenase YgiN
MIIVHGSFPLNPELRDDALDMMRRMASASRAEFGCISYEFYVGLSDPNTLMLFQEWESVEALQDHFDTEHMEEFTKLLPSVLDGEVATRRYEVRANQEDLNEPQDVDGFSAQFEPREKIVH